MCIIASIPTESGPILLKNRDRNYYPDMKLFHVTWNGMEVAVLADMHTEWMEGMSEAGVAIVNSALMVHRDEKESKKSKKGKKTHDGKRIMRGLRYTDIDEVIESLTTYRKGLKGHTFIATKDSLWSIESYPGYDPLVFQLDPNKLHVRTNHGHLYKDLGYTEEDGIDFNSTRIRYRLAQKMLKGKTTEEEIVRALNTPVFELENPYNMVRRTDNMRTSSQWLLNPGAGKTSVHIVWDQTKSFEVVDRREDSGSPLKIPNEIIQL